MDIVKSMTVRFKRVNFMLCELCTSKTQREKRSKESEDRLEGQGQGKESLAVTKVIE